MEKNFKVSLRKTPEFLRSYIENKVRELRETPGKIDGEYEKNPIDVKAISFINLILSEKIEKLKIQSPGVMDPSRIHLLNNEASERLGLVGSIQAHYYPTVDSIFVNRDKFQNSKLKLYLTILHEAIHHYSYTDIMYDNLVGENSKITASRSGYDIYNKFNSPNNKHFVGFNEALIQRIASRLFEQNVERFIKEWQITENEIDDLDEFGDSYNVEDIIIQTIIDKIAKLSQQDSDTISKDWENGVFTGKMYHLRDIEKYFGPGALRVIASLSSEGSMSELSKKDYFFKIQKFFLTDSLEERNIIATEILSERERLKYKEHQRFMS